MIIPQPRLGHLSRKSAEYHTPPWHSHLSYRQQQYPASQTLHTLLPACPAIPTQSRAETTAKLLQRQTRSPLGHSSPLTSCCPHVQTCTLVNRYVFHKRAQHTRFRAQIHATALPHQREFYCFNSRPGTHLSTKLAQISLAVRICVLGSLEVRRGMGQPSPEQRLHELLRMPLLLLPLLEPLPQVREWTAEVCLKLLGYYLTMNLGTTAKCGGYYKVQSGDICQLVALNNTISIALFEAINPSINSNCTNLVPGLYYCVFPSANWNVTGNATTVTTTVAAPAPTTSGKFEVRVRGFEDRN